jgi:hypothetical protein
LPGRIPVVETLPNQNLVAVNSQIQLKGSFYLGEENLMEVGFLVSPISGFVENDQSLEKFIVNKSDLFASLVILIAGSTPIQSKPFFCIILSNDPSLDPISIIFLEVLECNSFFSVNLIKKYSNCFDKPAT